MSASSHPEQLCKKHRGRPRKKHTHITKYAGVPGRMEARQLRKKALDLGRADAAGHFAIRVDPVKPPVRPSRKPLSVDAEGEKFDAYAIGKMC